MGTSSTTKIKHRWWSYNKRVSLSMIMSSTTKRATLLNPDQIHKNIRTHVKSNPYAWMNILYTTRTLSSKNTTRKPGADPPVRRDLAAARTPCRWAPPSPAVARLVLRPRQGQRRLFFLFGWSSIPGGTLASWVQSSIGANCSAGR